MKDCTGEQYAGQFEAYSKFKNWHGKFGHINLAIKDHDSVITGYGAHDRVVCYCPEGDIFHCRIDHIWGLGMPSEKQIIKVAKSFPSEIKGKWQLIETDKEESGKCTFLTFKKKIRNK